MARFLEGFAEFSTFILQQTSLFIFVVFPVNTVKAILLMLYLLGM